MRYYSTQRPVGPGTFPKLPENKVLEVHNFDAKTFCEEIGREDQTHRDSASVTSAAIPSAKRTDPTQLLKLSGFWIAHMKLRK